MTGCCVAISVAYIFCRFFCFSSCCCSNCCCSNCFSLRFSSCCCSSCCRSSCCRFRFFSCSWSSCSRSCFPVIRFSSCCCSSCCRSCCCFSSFSWCSGCLWLSHIIYHSFLWINRLDRKILTIIYDTMFYRMRSNKVTALASQESETLCAFHLCLSSLDPPIEAGYNHNAMVRFAPETNRLRPVEKDRRRRYFCSPDRLGFSSPKFY